MVPGAILGAGIAIFLSIQLANGTIDLKAPQANAFATFSIILAEGQGDYWLLGLGAALGVFVEMATGMGTSFGLGMYLDLPHTLPMLIGGVARDKWEEKKLDPEIELIKEEEGPVVAEKKRALILLSTFMVAAGLLTAEAFFGMESAIFAFLDTLELVSNPTAWYWIRMAGFIGFNLLLGVMIYLMFKSAGIIGQDDGEVDAAA